MVFQFRDSTFCVGKWTSSVDVEHDECKLEAIVSTGVEEINRVDYPHPFAKLRTVSFTDKDGLPIKLKAGAHELLNSAVHKHWSHVNLADYQK